MLQLSKSLSNRPVLSLRTGARIGTTTQPLVNPNNLKIEGWLVEDRFDQEILVLLVQDVRDTIQRGIIVDDHDVLAKPEDLIRLREILELNFDPLGKHVVSDHKRRLGKVADYAVEMDSMFIQKLYVEQSIIRSLGGGQLSIDRTQIIEITPKKITVREADERVSAPTPVSRRVMRTSTSLAAGTSNTAATNTES